VINLANNAIKFTDQGQVRVDLAREALHGRFQVTIRVMDTGIGITAENRAKLFQEFVRVDSAEVRQREGTVLGLRLSRKLAHLLGDEIDLALASLLDFGQRTDSTRRQPELTGNRSLA